MLTKNKKINRVFFLIYFLLLDCMVFAQPNDEDGDNDLEGNDVPINKFIVLLFIIGVLYAYYFINKKTREALIKK